MLNIVKSLLFRLKQTKMFWIMLGLCALGPVLALLLNQLVLEIAKVITPLPSDLGLETVTYMSLTGLASIASTTNFLALLCVSIFLSKEFTDGTIRNALLSNKSRWQLYGAYGVVSLIVGGSFLMANFVSILLALGIPFGFGSVAPNQAISSILCSLMLGICAVLFVTSCVLMFLFATGKQGASIILPILVTIFLPDIVASVVEIATTMLMLAQMGGNTAVELGNDFYSWIPLYNSYLYDATSVDGGLVAKIAMYYLAFSGLFVWWGSAAALKKDLK